MSDFESQLESVTVRIANLELTITARPIQPATTESSEPASGPAASEAAYQFHPTTRAFEDRVIAARTAALCAALPLDFLGPIASRLRGAGEWTPAARVGRAYRAGVIARRQLGGTYQSGQSPAIAQQDTIYIVLRARSDGPAFWTSRYNSQCSVQ